MAAASVDHDSDLAGVRALEDTTRAIKARIVKDLDDRLIPEAAIKLIDWVVETCEKKVKAHASDADTDDGRFERIHGYYKEYIRRVAPSMRQSATRHFDRYMAALIRGAQSTRYSVWTDGVEVYAA